MRWGYESSNVDESVLSWFTDFLVRQIELLNSLIEVESRSKWALVAVVETMQRYLSVVVEDDNTAQYCTKIKEVLLFLCEIDAKHINRYRYLGAAI